MSRKYEAPMTIYRVFGDEEIEIDGTVSGVYCPPEPGVGIFSPWFEDVEFKSDAGEYFELNNNECGRAVELLREAEADPYDGA